MNLFPILKTRRCVLEQMSLADASMMQNIIADDDVKRFMPEFYSTFNSIDSLKELIQTFTCFWNSKTGLLWSVRVGENLIGFIGIMDIPINATLFYGTDKSYRNNGYMKECMKECVEYFKRSYPGINIYSEVFEDNTASLKILSYVDVKIQIRERKT